MSLPTEHPIVTDYLNGFDRKESEFETDTQLSDSELRMLRQELQDFLNSIVPADVSDTTAAMTILKHSAQISAIFKRGFDTAVSRQPLSLGRMISRIFLALIVIGTGMAILYGLWLRIGPLF